MAWGWRGGKRGYIKQGSVLEKWAWQCHTFRGVRLTQLSVPEVHAAQPVPPAHCLWGRAHCPGVPLVSWPHLEVSVRSEAGQVPCVERDGPASWRLLTKVLGQLLGSSVGPSVTLQACPACPGH